MTCYSIRGQRSRRAKAYCEVCGWSSDVRRGLTKTLLQSARDHSGRYKHNVVYIDHREIRYQPEGR